MTKSSDERGAVQLVQKGSAAYPAILATRLGAGAPCSLAVLGNVGLLDMPKTALFCSEHCPGSAILAAYDQAANWRNAGRCIVSGFHSPVEKECLRILLRGKQPIIICPARGLPKRLPPEWRQPLVAGRLLILSAFPETETRVTSDLARRRNEIVAALADEAYFAYITPGGHTDLLSKLVAHWNSRLTVLESNTTTPIA